MNSPDEHNTLRENLTNMALIFKYWLDQAVTLADVRKHTLLTVKNVLKIKYIFGIILLILILVHIFSPPFDSK